MSWSFSGKAAGGAFAAEVKRVFAEGQKQVADSPASIRALRAIETFVEAAPYNIPAGAEIHFVAHGHLDQNGRGSLAVSVKVVDTA